MSNASALAYAIISTMMVSGCAPRVEYRYIERHIVAPPAPVLPRIKAHELECLSDDVYRRLYERERLRREDSERLRAIIHSTEPKSVK